MKAIEFTPPPALQSAVGEGLKAGQKLEMLAEFRVKDDGDWCLTAVEGVAMPGYDKPESYPQQSEFVNTYKENAP